MKRMLFNATYQEELRVACVDGKKLLNFDIETASKTQKKGNIYCGIITRVEYSLEACFVEYGTGKQGFLPFKEIYLPNAVGVGRSRDFSKIVEGTKVIVQVEKDERGNKGAALTTFVSLPGRYLVLMPNTNKTGGISRRIDGEEREELKNLLSQLELPNNMSVIARTAALGRMKEELQWDLNYLLKLWDAIVVATDSHEKALIYQESNLVIRSIRDHFAPDISEILIDEIGVYNEARNFMSSIMPHFVNKIKYYSDDIQLFSRFQIEHQIEAAYSRTVNLPSGGAIVIDRTEALTAIDVNSAKSNKGADIEATALATNLEAAEEISRQLRLRDVGGLVVVDFIDMENFKNQRDVEVYFKEQLSLDRARIQMGKLSKFGLLELSRQRLKNSLEESTTITCPRCVGIGLIRGTESIALHILRIIQEEMVKSSQYLHTIHVQLPVDVATYLLNERREDILKLEHRLKINIVLIPNQNLESPNYKIKKINQDTAEMSPTKMSYNLVDTFEDNQNNYVVDAKKLIQPIEKPAVGIIKPNQPAPKVSKSLFGNLVESIYNKISNVISGSKERHQNLTQIKSKNLRTSNKTHPNTKSKISSHDSKIKNNHEVNLRVEKSNLFNITKNDILDTSNSKSLLTTKVSLKKPLPSRVIKNVAKNVAEKINQTKESESNQSINNSTKLEPKNISTHIVEPKKTVQDNLEPLPQKLIEEKSKVLKMEMVTTNLELYKNRELPNIKSMNNKRYIDIPKSLDKTNVEYTLVETKKNSCL